MQYLREQGYVHARGYDPYAQEGEHAEPLEPGFDFIISQDVIEHVADPAAYLRTLKGLARAGGVLVIGSTRRGLGGSRRMSHSTSICCTSPITDISCHWERW